MRTNDDFLLYIAIFLLIYGLLLMADDSKKSETNSPSIPAISTTTPQ